MARPPLLPVSDIHERLRTVFHEGTPNRGPGQGGDHAAWLCGPGG